MRRTWLAVVLTLCTLPLSAPAQTTEVYTGEHSDFTRLAMVFDRETTWQVVREAGGWRISFSPGGLRMDLTGIYDRISRDRIEAVSQSNSGDSIFIASSCDCHLDAFLAETNTLAIDVKDGPGALVGIATAGTRPRLLPPDTLFLVPPTPTLTSPSDVNADQSNRRLNEFRADSPARARPSPAQQSAPAIGEREAAWQAALREQLRLAAEAGLVDLTEAPGPTDSNARRSQGEPSVSVGSDGPDMSGEANIALRTAYEGIGGTRPDEDAGLQRCPPAETLSFLTGEDPLAGLPGVGAARGRLIDARDGVSPAGAAALVREYLSLGFGAEAAALIPAAGFSTPEADRLKSVARIVDGRSDQAPAVWGDLARCDSPVALWAVLGRSVDALPAEPDTDAVQRAFFALPPHLRRHLGKELATRLRKLGDHAGAGAIESSAMALLRPTTAGSDTGGRSPAVTAEASGAQGASARRLEDLLERLRNQMQNGEPISSRDAQTAEAFLWEQRETETGARLRAGIALSALQSGDVDPIVTFLADGGMAALEDPAWQSDVGRSVVATLLAGREATLLTAVLHPSAELVTDLMTVPDRLLAARTLLDTGFPETAAGLLSAVDPRRNDGAALLLAEARIESGDPMIALAMLAGRTDADTALLRARALSALGRHALAADAFSDAGMPDAAAQAAWLSGDADAIRLHGAPERFAEVQTGADLAGPGQAGEAQRRLASEGDQQQDAAPVPTLAATRALVERSADLRRRLEDLVDEAADPS